MAVSNKASPSQPVNNISSISVNYDISGSVNGESGSVINSIRVNNSSINSPDTEDKVPERISKLATLVNLKEIFIFHN